MLSEEHLAVSEMCKNFAANELAPTAAMHDKTHTFPENQVKMHVFCNVSAASEMHVF